MCHIGAAGLAEVLVFAERLAAEGNEAETEDPAAKDNDDPEEEPLGARLLVLDFGQAFFAACVALHLEGLHMVSGNRVGGDH